MLINMFIARGAMNRLPSIQNALSVMAFTEDELRYGLQLSASVVIAYLIPWALDLPEGFWAVMSALIVMRARTGSTLGEGWGRFKGAMTGTVGGLFGVWLHTHGMVTSVATLGVIAALAFIAGIFPALRSAPITALIILSSGGIAGHSAWQVAGLRIVEIVIGIGAGLLVSLLTPGSRSAAHFEQSVTTLLTDIGEQARRALTGGDVSADDKEEANRKMRLHLGRLAILAASADTEHGFALAKKKGAKVPRKYQRCAKLINRIVQDAGLFGRIFDSAPELQADPVWEKVAHAVPLALATASDEEQDNPLAPLLNCLLPDADVTATTERLHRLLEAPIRLLAADIQSLRRFQRA